MSVKKKIILVVQTLTAKTQMAAMCVSVTMDMNVMILGTVQVILFLFVFFSVPKYHLYCGITSISIRHQILTNVIMKTMCVQRILHALTNWGPMSVCVR